MTDAFGFGQPNAIDNVRRCRTKVVISHSHSSPDVVVLHQVRVDGHVQFRCLTKGGTTPLPRPHTIDSSLAASCTR